MLEAIAASVKDFDIVAIQEVLVSEGGAKALARLVNVLNQKGASWDYVISNPTGSENIQERERYAFIWKSAKVKRKGRAFLAGALGGLISREPFVGTFESDGKEFTLVNFHAVPKKKQPETEIKYLDSLCRLFPQSSLIFLGDFNCPESHSVFNTLKSAGIVPALVGQKTTLRQECIKGDCLASAYDNIFYPARRFSKIRSGIIAFYRNFDGNMLAARKLSDHVPVFLEIK